jgi:PAS domain S-box-containing protein
MTAMSTEQITAAISGAAAPRELFSLSSLMDAQRWKAYFGNPTTYLGLLLVVCNGFVAANYFGVSTGIAWSVLAAEFLLAVVYLSIRTTAGDEHLRRLSVFVHAALIGLWMIYAIGLWTTGEPAAWVIAVMICSSWSIHIMFSGQSNSLRTVLGVLSIVAVPLLCFLIFSAWSGLPTWAAVPMTISSVAMVASIAASAQTSNKNYAALKTAMAEAAATRQRLEFAIQSAGDGYFEIDLETMIYTPNPALALALGFEPGGKDMTALRDRVHEDDAEETFGRLSRVIKGEIRGWKQELRIRVASGGFRWMQLRAQVIEGNTAKDRKLIGTVVDLTPWKTLEAELRAAKEAAEASNQAKSQFLANMSHEIRTPLNGVLGMAQALEQDQLDPAQKEKVAIILDSGKSLMSLLNDVLDLTKIEAGKLEISAVPGDFLHTMKRTRQLFQTTAEDKGLELLVRYDSNFPQRLTYDPTRVRQCVANMLSNAIKFTAKGRVEVGISAKKLPDGQHMVAVDVIDTGIGMSAETIAKLFTVFTQADGATTRKFGGSGLGLAISRQLARMMGGDLTVESEEGRGSTFRLTFKAAEAAPSAAPAPSSAPAVSEKARRSMRGLRVLLTDDNAINRQVIKLFLAPQGLDIVEATNGKEALDKIATQDFDIVLLDVHMPVMDGKEAIQRIRNANQAWSAIPVIALTADAMSGDREKYLALGMTDYVSKPVDQRELLAKMHQVLGLAAPQPTAKTGT